MRNYLTRKPGAEYSTTADAEVSGMLPFPLQWVRVTALCNLTRKPETSLISYSNDKFAPYLMTDRRSIRPYSGTNKTERERELRREGGNPFLHMLREEALT